MNEADAIGGIVTGGLAARAVEPAAGEGAHGGAGSCLNCGTALAGDYCHECGQHGHVHRTLGAFWHDLLHGVLHFEGKIWRTLPLLAWRPGELTRRYVEGERAKFVSPMAIFLFSVFLMFASFSALGGHAKSNDGPGIVDVGTDADEERQEAIAQLAKLQAERAQAVKEKRSTRPIDVSITSVRQELAILNAIDGKDAATDGGAFVETPVEGNFVQQLVGKAKANPELLAYKLQSNGYKFSWALIPISVPFVWLLFLHRRRHRAYRAYDHTVFVTYSIAFMSLGVVALAVANAVGLKPAVLVLTALIVPPFHMYRQLRGAYRLGRFSALWRTLLLLLFSVIAASLFFAGLFALGISH